MATSRRKTLNRPRIYFDIPENQWDFWEGCQNQAKHQHVLLRDWLQQQVIAAQDQAHAAAVQATPWYQGLQHGRQQGYLMAQLDTAFTTGTAHTLDRARIIRWQRQYPKDWQDVVLWAAQQPWAAHFTRWVQAQESSTLRSADHSH